jgi:hypothetical protein
MRGVKGSAVCGTTSKYTHGCRCEDCRTANREYQRQRTRTPPRVGRLPTLAGVSVTPEPSAGLQVGVGRFVTGVTVRCVRCGTVGRANPKIVSTQRRVTCGDCQRVA